jgi:hypothetical protein
MQDLCGDYSDRVITSPFPIADPIEYSTKKELDFVQLSFLINVFPKLKMQNFMQFLPIVSLRKNYNHKLTTSIQTKYKQSECLNCY